MVAGLEKIDCLVADPLDQPLFLGDAPRPTAGGQKLQCFGLARRKAASIDGVPGRPEQVGRLDESGGGRSPLTDATQVQGLPSRGELKLAAA